MLKLCSAGPSRPHANSIANAHDRIPNGPKKSILCYPGASNHKTYPYLYGTRLTTHIHNEKTQTTAVIVEGEV